MMSFEAFNFDVIILIIFISNMVFGAYYGIFRQIKSTIRLLIPIIVLYFTLSKIICSLESIPWYINAQEKIFTFLNSFSIIGRYKYLYSTIIVALILYFIMFSVISIIFNAFGPKKDEMLYNVIKKSSRIIGSMISLISSYIISLISLYLLSVMFVVNTNKPITKLLNFTNNEVLTFSMLNDYQNIIVDEYNSIEKNENRINGNNILKEYSNLEKIYNEYNEYQSIFINNVFPNLTETGLSHYNLAKSEKMSLEVLLLKIGKRQLYTYLLVDEKYNEKTFEQLNKVCDYIKLNDGYCYIFNNLLEKNLFEYEPSELHKMLSDNKDMIYSQFTNSKVLSEYISFFNNLDFYLEYSNLLFSFAYSDDTFNNYLEYSRKMKNCFTDDEKLNSFIRNFSIYFTDDKIYVESNESLLEFKKSIDKYVNINSEITMKKMSFSSKIALANAYNEFFIKHKWEKFALTRSYIKDTISDNSLKGYNLYSEYLFGEYLFKDNSLININSFIVALNNIDILVEKNILSVSSAKLYLESLFNEEGKITSLNKQGLIDANLYHDLYVLDNKYISENLKNTYLNK